MKILFRFEIFVVFSSTLEFEKTESDKIKLFFKKLKDEIKNLEKTKNPETRFNEEQEVVEPLRRSTRKVVQFYLAIMPMCSCMFLFFIFII